MDHPDCLFCKIIKGEINSTKVYEDENVIGFKDIYPQAEIHNLFIHKKHTKDIAEMLETDFSQIEDLMKAISKYVSDNGYRSGEKAFRLVNNCGPGAGQTVFHTHIHFLSGKELGSFG
ncbi:MAG: HIT domain-containing protein [Bacteriovoracaceae bacterium]